ncbi:tetratricopeptide repeat protein [Piscinibacter defluvii]|uniref:tetratricopeptide repeat protein n=1 Tax=Piscinibacter defluvii TaxID=1796922 RepID=UPI0013E38682|nr:tetratricopeptide repeat protein [Piscinibacter defluvii]
MAKVYVSSTVADLEPERRAVIEWLVQARHQPVHSYLPDSDTVRDSCLADVDGCDVYVVLLGHRYGFQPPDGNPERLSITHMEYRRARDGRKPCVALKARGVRDLAVTDLLDAARQALVLRFQQEVEADRRVALFDDEGSLIKGLSAGVQEAVARLAPPPLDDPQVQRIIARLTTDKLGLEEENAELRRQIAALNEQLTAEAIARTVATAQAPGASPAARDAAQALQQGDAAPALALLREQEREASAAGAATGSRYEELADRRRAAELAREQGALAFAVDVRASLAAYRRADEHDPGDFWTSIRIGDLQRLRGTLDEALAAYWLAFETASAQTAQDPADTQWQRNLSVSHERIGNVLVAQGDLLGALQAYRKSLDIRETLAGRDAGNIQWQRDLSVSHDRIGDMLVAQGELPVALQAYRKSLDIREALAGRDAGNAEWQRNLSVSHNKIGDVLVAQGDLPGALQAYRKSLDIREALAGRNAGNPEWQRDLSVSHERIGDMLVAQGDLPGALQAYRKSLDIAETLAGRDAGNTQWQRDLSVSHNKIGDVLVELGDLPGALQAYRKDLAIAEELAGRDFGNTQWQRDLSVSHDKIGDVLVAQGDLPGALQAYRKSLDIAEALAGRDLGSVQWQLDVAVSCGKLGGLDLLPPGQRRDHLERGARILAALRLAGRLPPNQDWTAWFDQALKDLA